MYLQNNGSKEGKEELRYWRGRHQVCLFYKISAILWLIVIQP